MCARQGEKRNVFISDRCPRRIFVMLVRISVRYTILSSLVAMNRLSGEAARRPIDRILFLLPRPAAPSQK